MIEKILNLSLETECEVEKEVWKLKFLRPNEKMNRASVVSGLLNLAPVDSVTTEDYNRAFIMATLQLAYVAGPPWFKEKFKEKFIDFPDESYLVSLYNEYSKKESEFEEGKKKLRLGSGSQTGPLGS